MTPPVPVGPDPPPVAPAGGAPRNSSPVALTQDEPDDGGGGGGGRGGPKQGPPPAASGGGAPTTGRPPSGAPPLAAEGGMGSTDGGVGDYGGGVGGGGGGGGSSGGSGRVGDGGGGGGGGGVSAAGPPPAPILDMGTLSEAYGAALARSVDAARLGLNMKAVAAGMAGAALDGTDFPMPLPEYERQMGAVQAAAVSAGAAAALAEADRFFAATAADPDVEEVVPGAVLVERGEAGGGGVGVGGLLGAAWAGSPVIRGADGGSGSGGDGGGGGGGGGGGVSGGGGVDRPPRRRTVAPGATVALVLQGRLLDGTYFYASPVANPTGGWSSPSPAVSGAASWAGGGAAAAAAAGAGGGGRAPDPLVMDLTEAPPAFGAGLVGMAEGDERTLYVHPRGDAGMRGLFGAGLPPNGLLVFDVVCVSADVADDEEWGGA